MGNSNSDSKPQNPWEKIQQVDLEKCKEWSREEVAYYIENNLKLSREIADKFYQNFMAGPELLEITEKDLQSIGVLALGAVKTILRAVKNLDPASIVKNAAANSDDKGEINTAFQLFCNEFGWKKEEIHTVSERDFLQIDRFVYLLPKATNFVESLLGPKQNDNVGIPGGIYNFFLDNVIAKIENILFEVSPDIPNRKNKIQFCSEATSGDRKWLLLCLISYDVKLMENDPVKYSHDPQIDVMINLGYKEEQVKEAWILSQFNKNKALEYLVEGIPDRVKKNHQKYYFNIYLSLRIYKQEGEFPELLLPKDEKPDHENNEDDKGNNQNNEGSKVNNNAQSINLSSNIIRNIIPIDTPSE